MEISEIDQKQRGTWRLPRHGWLGLLLVLVFWALNWGLDGLRTQWGFSGLWLGYCLLVDGLVYARKGSSLLSRSWRAYLLMFAVSACAWWVFEVINWRTENWWYDGRQYFSDLQYFLLASASFATVMPAVFGTAELYGTAGWLVSMRKGPLIRPSRGVLRRSVMTGLVMLGLLLLWPRYFFPLVWISLYFILEPLNAHLGYRSLANDTARGDWRPVVALWLGGLTCGLLWEMWNYYSYPKWLYRVPFVDFWRVFEMPLLGYGGYMPFALELFAFYHYVTGVIGLKSWRADIRLVEGQD